MRVDIFYADATPRAKAAVDFLGALLLLLPFMLVIFLFSRALRRALLGDPRTLAGGRRPAAGLSAQDADPAVCRAAGLARCRAGDPRRADAGCTLMALSETLSVLMVAAVIVALLAGYPVAADARRRVARLRGAWAARGRDELRHPRRAARPHLRRDDQRGAAGDPAVHLHGRDAGAIAHRRRSARAHGAAVRHRARRARLSRWCWSARCSRPRPAWSAPPR